MENYSVKSASKAFLWAMFLPLILGFVITIVLSLFYKDAESLQKSWVYIFACVIVAQVAFAIIYLRFIKKNKINIKTEVIKQTKTFSFKNALFCVLISVIAIFGLFYFVGLFDVLFGYLGYVPEESILPNNTILWLLVNILLSAVLPAIFEELIFRSVIFRGLKNKGFWFACIVSSIMFMLVHLSLGSVVYPILMGIIFCLIVKKTGSVVYSAIVHFCNNSIALIIQYIQNANGINLFPPASLWWQVLLAILVAALSYGLILLIIKFCLKNKTENDSIISVDGDNVKEVLISQDAKSENENSEENKEVLQNSSSSQNPYLSENAMVLYSVLIGFAFWLIMLIV